MSGMQRQGRFFGLVFIIVGCLVLPLVAGELTLRMVKFPSPIASGWGWEQSPRRALSSPDDRAHNQLGLRGPPSSYGPDDVVVLLLGDSQVEVARSRSEL